MDDNQKGIKPSFAGFLWSLGWTALGSVVVFLVVSSKIVQDSSSLALLTVSVCAGLLCLLPAFQHFPSGAIWTTLFAAGFWSRWLDTTTSIGGSSDITYSRIELAVGVAWVVFGIYAIRDVQRNKTIPVVPAIFCLVGGWLIAHFSSEAGGASGMVDWLIQRIGLTSDMAETVATVSRKSVHFLFYGLLSLAAFRLANRGGASRGWAVAWAFAFCLALSLFDETRQSLMAGRTGSVVDVLLDTAGMAVFVGIGFAFSGRGSKPAT